MQVQRLDLGADVVFIPSRDMLVIHPDLDYAESLGAVAGALPDLHLDVVVGLVERVTPRPRDRRTPREEILRAVAVLAALVAVLLGSLAFSQPATAGATFGEIWQAEMAEMGLDCSEHEATWTCVNDDGEVTRVTGFRRHEASLYVLRRSNGGRLLLMIFDNREAAQRYEATHPNATVTGRVASL